MITMKTSITSISVGQKEQCVNVVKDASRKGAEQAIDELSGSGIVNAANFQRLLGQGDKISARVRTFVKKLVAELAENITGYVRLISGAEVLTLDPTDGKETIAKAGDLFTGYLDDDFESYGTNVPSPATGKMNVAVHEMIKDGTFAQIFGSMSDDLNSLCLTQPQIIQFLKKHRKWLHADGYGTFFLFKVAKGNDSELVVARVFGDEGLRANVHRFSYDGVRNAGLRLRVVVPQLPLAN
jgi:hypothetical protein